MKIVFLDIDGVCNSINSMMEAYHEKVRLRGEGFKITRAESIDMDFHLPYIKRINKLLADTGANVVISSSWRTLYNMEELKQILERNGFVGNIIGYTPRLNTERGHEIQKWLDDNSHLNIEKFVILDDEQDMVHLKPRLVKTACWHGFQIKHYYKALWMLT